MGQELLGRQFFDSSTRMRRLRTEYRLSELTDIVIIEDEYLIASDLRNVLRLAGCPVIEMVADVPDALSVLSDRSPDAAILDVNLKGEMVFPVADIFLERRIPFVFVTGHERFVIPPRFNRVVRCQKPIEPVEAVMTLLWSARQASARI